MAHVATATTQAVFNPVTLVTDLMERFAKWRKVSHTFEELSALSDRELDDLGFGRGDLFRVAMESVYGPDALK